VLFEPPRSAGLRTLIYQRAGLGRGIGYHPGGTRTRWMAHWLCFFFVRSKPGPELRMVWDEFARRKRAQVGRAAKGTNKHRKSLVTRTMAATRRGHYHRVWWAMKPLEFPATAGRLGPAVRRWCHPAAQQRSGVTLWLLPSAFSTGQGNKALSHPGYAPAAHRAIDDRPSFWDNPGHVQIG